MTVLADAAAHTRISDANAGLCVPYWQLIDGQNFWSGRALASLRRTAEPYMWVKFARAAPSAGGNSLPLDNFCAGRMPATEGVGHKRSFLHCNRGAPWLFSAIVVFQAAAERVFSSPAIQGLTSARFDNYGEKPSEIKVSFSDWL